MLGYVYIIHIEYYITIYHILLNLPEVYGKKCRETPYIEDRNPPGFLSWMFPKQPIHGDICEKQLWNS